MRNASDKGCRETHNTRFVFSDFFRPLENRTVYEIMRENIGTKGQVTDDNMAHAHWMRDT